MRNLVLVDTAAAAQLSSSGSYATTVPVPTAVIPESSALVPGNVHEPNRSPGLLHNKYLQRFVLEGPGRL